MTSALADESGLADKSKCLAGFDGEAKVPDSVLVVGRVLGQDVAELHFSLDVWIAVGRELALVVVDFRNALHNFEDFRSGDLRFVEIID